jgi:hypothetical protein
MPGLRAGALFAGHPFPGHQSGDPLLGAIADVIVGIKLREKRLPLRSHGSVDVAAVPAL